LGIAENGATRRAKVWPLQRHYKDAGFLPLKKEVAGIPKLLSVQNMVVEVLLLLLWVNLMHYLAYLKKAIAE